MEALLKRISEKKQKFDSRKSLDKELEAALFDWMSVAFTYSSNAIEGNKLSFQETARILGKDTIADCTSLAEYLEAIKREKAIKRAAQKEINGHRKELGCLLRGS
ncbi:MAG: hypothetical protein WCW33_02840 [Candidatus Babeliales bacterium]